MSSVVVASGQIWRHYKGKLYQIITVARSTSDPERKSVVYKALYYDPIYGYGCVWNRDLDEFIGHVVIDDNTTKLRFVLLHSQ